MSELPVVRVAMVLGALGCLGLIAANGRTAWKWLPVLLAGFIGVAVAFRLLHPAYVLESLLLDPPWVTAALLALFTGLGASGALRVTSWPSVVLATALFGDTLVATGLALAEPDDTRRARLVLAASAASLISPWSGATVIALGHGSWALAALGLGLAVVGFTPGGGKPSFVKPDYSLAWRGALVPVWLALLVWVFMLGGVSEFGAMGLESLPPLIPGHAAVWAAMAATLFGALGYEPGAALFGQDILLHATQVRGPWAGDALRVGLSIGAGLPMMLATKCKLTVGLPLWVAQILLAMAYFWVRYPV